MIIILAVCRDLRQIEIENGDSNYSMEGRFFGSFRYRPNGTVAMYTCNDGFKLDGNVNRTCDTGNWTGTVPVCVEGIYIRTE